MKTGAKETILMKNNKKDALQRVLRLSIIHCFFTLLLIRLSLL
jgi:hypothetical protein